MSLQSFFLAEVASLCGIDASTIDLDRPLISYGLDSVRAFDLICALEDEYDIEIADEHIPTLRTARDVINHVQTLL